MIPPILGLVSSVFIIAHLTTSRLANAEPARDPSIIQVKGATDTQLAKLRTALENGAYGPPQATALTEDDECEFYKPPQKLRLFKSMPNRDSCELHAKKESEAGTAASAAVIADTARSVIFLCKNGVTVADYDFSMGRDGINKRAEGDLKTPIGKYPMSKPVRSDKFKIYIGIGYPTPEQARQGYTGSDIGIHGPSRRFRCAGFLNAAVDWTQGCLAVSSDVFVKEIARFVETNNVRSITIY